jgi:hypothetical protein
MTCRNLCTHSLMCKYSRTWTLLWHVMGLACWLAILGFYCRYQRSTTAISVGKLLLPLCCMSLTLVPIICMEFTCSVFLQLLPSATHILLPLRSGSSSSLKRCQRPPPATVSTPRQAVSLCRSCPAFMRRFGAPCSSAELQSTLGSASGVCSAVWNLVVAVSTGHSSWVYFWWMFLNLGS